MLVTTIAMWPHGDDSTSSNLVTIVIWNDGTGLRSVGNYEWRICHQADSTFGEKAAEKTAILQPDSKRIAAGEDEAWIWKRGRLAGFRRSKGAATLLAEVLREARLC